MALKAAFTCPHCDRRYHTASGVVRHILRNHTRGSGYEAPGRPETTQVADAKEHK